MRHKVSAALAIVLSAFFIAVGVASASETISYSYDAKGRLRLVTHSGSVNNNVVTNYTIDAADNRTRVKVTSAP